MRTLRLYAVRSVAFLASSFVASFASSLFLAVTSFLFSRSLAAAEGTSAAVPVLWATSATVTLPCLAAFLTMRLIADDRQSGRLELLLSSPVYERDYVLGRFCGAFLCVMALLTAYLAVPLALLPWCGAGRAVASLSLADFLPAMAGLLMQGMLGCAVGVLASACVRQAAVACAVTVGATVLLPHAAYHAAFAWLPAVRARFPMFPGELHLADAASGMFAFSATMFFASLSAWALFAAVKAVAATRFAGRSARGLKLSTSAVVLLGAVFCALVCICAARLDFTVECPLGRRMPGFSARTRSILSDTHGETRATCFMSRSDPAWRGVARLLRGFEAAARDSAGTRLAVDFADPRWDLSSSVRLTRAGVKEGSVVFERGRRRIVLPVAEMDESTCASALLRLSLPAGRENVYWTVGHGENPFDAYGPATGMSMLARSLRRDGYDLKTLDTATATVPPEDCSVLVVAGANTRFSAAELALVESYLRQGGRLLALVSPGGRTAGVMPLLAEWGVRALPFTAVSPKTQDGSNLVAADFGDHDITRPLAGTMVVFNDAVPLAAAEVAVGGEKTTFTPLVRTDALAWGESDIAHHPWTHDAATEPTGPLVLAAALERGAGPRRDIALKPTRIVVVGDASFAVDGALATRGNSNRDLFRNALAWLAGLDAATASGTPADVLVTGMDRAQRVRFTVAAAAVMPAVLLLFGAMAALRRRFG